MKGSQRTAAKAPRANDRRDGRKSAFAVGDQALANDHAPLGYRGRTGIITEVGQGASEFRVEFEDGRQPTTGYLMSGWLDRV